jgi:catechol 2,3-dioxygenase-like lactoylglutathione lyase family enzyme
VLKALHHVRIGVTDLERTAQFATDFGLTVAHREANRIYFRCAGADAYNLVVEPSEQAKLIAIAFLVESGDALESASQMHSSRINELSQPFGGQSVTLHDPDEYRIDLIFGVSTREPDALRDNMIVNQGHAKERRGVTQVKRALGAPQLMRLGHIGLFVSNYNASDAWYREVLGFIPSDLMHAGPPANVIAGFYRVNRGKDWVDHHTLAMFGMGRRGLHHLSFEVQDSEAQFMAHRWMKQRGHSPVWGVGRHQLGSHIFDVWRDPDGNRFETYSDTDLLTADAKPALSPIDKVGLDLWSDDHFQKYFD